LAATPISPSGWNARGLFNPCPDALWFGDSGTLPQDISTYKPLWRLRLSALRAGTLAACSTTPALLHTNHVLILLFLPDLNHHALLFDSALDLWLSANNFGRNHLNLFLELLKSLAHDRLLDNHEDGLNDPVDR